MEFETEASEGIFNGTVDSLKSMLVVWAIDHKFRILEIRSTLTGSDFRLYNVFFDRSLVGSIRTQQLPAQKVLIHFTAVLLESKPDERFYAIRDALVVRLSQVGFKLNDPPDAPAPTRRAIGF